MKHWNLCSADGQGGQIDRRRTGGLGLDYECADISTSTPVGKDSPDGTATLTAQRQMVVAHNRNLIEYFARIGQSKDFNEHINLEYVESLLKNGANINCTDKYGQTIFHEVREPRCLCKILIWTVKFSWCTVIITSRSENQNMPWSLTHQNVILLSCNPRRRQPSETVLWIQNITNSAE